MSCLKFDNNNGTSTLMNALLYILASNLIRTSVGLDRLH